MHMEKLEKKWNSIKEKSYQLLCVIMFLLFLLLLLLVIENTSSFINVFIVLIGSIFYILLLVFLYRKFKKMQIKTHNRIAIFLTFTFFIIITIWGLSHRILLSSDVLRVTDKAIEMVNTKKHIVGSNVYLSKYPNQLPLVFLLYIVAYFGKAIFLSPENAIIIYNCIMLTITIYLIYKILKELFDSKIALIGMILFFLYPMFYLNVSLCYTDITSIPFPIIGYYLLIRANREEKLKKYLFLIFGGIFFAIGSKIRIVSCFLLIAYFLDLILKENRREFFKKSIPVLTSFIGIFVLYSTVILPYFQVDIDKNQTIPATHFLMMGLNTTTNGSYSGDDVMFTLEQKDKVKSNIEQIKDRLKDVNIDFYLKKMAITWTDKKYNMIAFYRNMSKLDGTQSYIMGYNSMFLRNILKIMRFVFYFLFLIMIGGELVRKEKYKKTKNSIFVISIFGAIFFYLLWEANERYGFSFITWLILGGASGIVFLDKFLEVKKISFNTKKINVTNIKKKSGIMLLFILSILLIDGFIEYSIRQKDIEVVRVNNYARKGAIDVKDDEVVEYFKLDKNFNDIELDVFDTNIKKRIPYIFELYDDKNKLIYRKKFLTTKNLGERKIRFQIPTVKVKTKKEYHFKIYSNEATEDNYLRIGINEVGNCQDKPITSKNYGYDSNPNGRTYVNKKLICYEIIYKVSEYKISNRIRKRYYIPFAVIIFGISYLGVYTCLIKKND